MCDIVNNYIETRPADSPTWAQDTHPTPDHWNKKKTLED